MHGKKNKTTTSTTCVSSAFAGKPAACSLIPILFYLASSGACFSCSDVALCQSTYGADADGLLLLCFFHGETPLVGLNPARVESTQGICDARPKTEAYLGDMCLKIYVF